MFKALVPEDGSILLFGMNRKRGPFEGDDFGIAKDLPF